MKIAYLNPWSSAAENQCYGSLAIAARRNGLELIDYRGENDLEPSRAEFVISHTQLRTKDLRLSNLFDSARAAEPLSRK
jgi:hypothetical protein